MAEIYDPIQALSTDWRSVFVSRKDDLFILPCEDGDVTLNGRWMLLNIMLTMPLIKRRRPINGAKHLITRGIYDNSSHAAATTQIAKSLVEAGYSREEIGQDILMTVMDAHNMCYTHLGAYVRSMDIDSIAATIFQDGVDTELKMDYGDVNDGNIKRMEKAFKKKSIIITDLLESNKLSTNVFRAPLLCGSLKVKQFHQFVLSAGPRTDTDDHIFKKPVIGSFLGGMQGIQDLAIESRSASKANHYNKTQMPTTSYQNRKISIQTSVIANIYAGDCGSNVFIDFVPTKDTVKHFEGRFFAGPDGLLMELTKERFPLVVDRKVAFRDPTTCIWQDGYCETCGGTLTRSFVGLGNAGFLSNVNTGAPVAQQVLSTKHLISTDAAEYEVPAGLSEYFISDTNDIYFRPEWRSRVPGMAIGFRPEDLAQLNDLRYHPDNMDIPAKRFTNIKFLYMGIVKADGSIFRNGAREPMGGETKIYPHLSPEVLHVIRNHPEDLVQQDGIAWLLMKNINPEDSVMQCTVVNNSIKRYVQRFSVLVTKDVERYHSLNDFLTDLTNLIWERVGTHSTHISCLAKACLITSRKDFNVPVVTNPDDVMFGTLHRNIAMRSIGGLMAFERYNQVTNKPATYITPKRDSSYDKFMGYTDQEKSDANWPLSGVNHLEEPLYEE